MTVRRAVMSIGVGIAGFLAAGAFGFEVFGEEFPSVFYVLPVALVVAVVAATGTRVVATRRPTRAVRSTLAGLAGFGYAFFLLWAVSYAVAATREVLTAGTIAALAVVAGGVVAAGAWIRDSRTDRA